MGTPTNNYNLQQPTVGGETGTWGTNLNNNTIAPLDTILGSVQPVTITSADVSLTLTQFQNGIFNITGGLTGNRNLFVPVGAVSTTTGAGGKFIVTNNTSNNFTITVNTTLSGAVGTVVPQAGRANLYCDGTNVKTADYGDLVGCFATTISSNPNSQLAGQAGSTAVGMNTQLAYDAVNNNLYACTTTGTSATAVWSQPNSVVTRGFDTAVNLQLSAAVSSNTLTVSILTSSGATPTVANPVTIIFPDNTVANGDPVSVNVTGALSIATSSAGSTLGSQNGTPFRFWIVGINNSGTAALGLINCISAGLQLFPLYEPANVTTTAMSTSANAAGTVYTSSTVGALTNKALRILGYLTYETALVTAGTYNATPDNVRLFGPGVKKPGDIIQVLYTSTNSPTSITTALTATNLNTSITPNSGVNPVSIEVKGYNRNGGASRNVLYQIYRNSGATAIGGSCGWVGNGSFPTGGAVSCDAFDFPAANGTSVQYGLYGQQNTGATANMFLDSNSMVGGSPTATMILKEFMG